MKNSVGNELRQRNKVKKRDEESGTIRDELFLPDDLIIEIISRLPTKDALRFRCVCKKCKCLIDSRDFIKLHIKRSVPMILVMNAVGCRQQFLLHEFWESKRTTAKIHKSSGLYPEYSMRLSQNGLIVSEKSKKSKKHKSPGDFIIFNPIYPEKVTISVASKLQSEIFGVFYRPSIKEYCTLWAMTVCSRPLIVQYKMLNLGPEPIWREITNPCSQNGRIQYICPVLVDQYLYWVVEPEPSFRDKAEDYRHVTFNVDIMEFDTRSERFEMIPCPVPVNFIRCKCNINLLHVNGLLLLVRLCPNQIDIWTLEDRANKIWTSSGTKYLCVDYSCKAIAIWNEEIVIDYFQMLYIHNLRLGTRRRFGRRYRGTASFASHVMSLASLKNCKSKICVVEEDESSRPVEENKPII